MPTYHTYTHPILGNLTTLAVQVPPAPSPVVLGWVISIKSGFSMGVHEWGNLAQTSKRRMATIFDGDSLSGSVAYLPGEQGTQLLTASLLSGAVVPWTITLPDTTTIAFNGFVSKLGPSFEQEDEVDADFEIAVDGPITITPPTS